MDDVIAVEVTLDDEERRYFITWGRIQDAVDPGPVAEVVLSHAHQFQLGAKAVSARVCESLREVAESSCAPYFFEALLRYPVTSIPFGSDYETWRQARSAAMSRGEEIFFCGNPS